MPSALKQCYLKHVLWLAGTCSFCAMIFWVLSGWDSAWKHRKYFSFQIVGSSFVIFFFSLCSNDFEIWKVLTSQFVASFTFNLHCVIMTQISQQQRTFFFSFWKELYYFRVHVNSHFHPCLPHPHSKQAKGKEVGHYGTITGYLPRKAHSIIDGDDDDDGCFYLALFSALEQTHCACMWSYMSD